MEDILEKLKIFDDLNFQFDVENHKYTVNGEHYISVTQFISKFHKVFETELKSKKKAEQTGVSQTEILTEWKRLNDRSNILGKETHQWIENYLNKVYQELPTDLEIIDRINKFNVAYAKWLYKLKPIKLEQRIFSKKWKIAGMVDALFEYNGNVFICDYKTNGKFTHDAHEKGRFEKLLEPFNFLYKNHLNEYSIQVSLYKLILKEIGIDVRACYLLHIGPDSEALMYKAHDFSDILEKYLITILDTF